MGTIAVVAAALIGPFLILLGLLYVGFRYVLQRKTGVPVNSTVQVSPGAALKAIQLALVGNRSMAFEAATQSLSLHLADGSLEQKLLQLGFKDLDRRAADPNAKLPIVDYVAHFTGFPRDQVIKFFEAESGVAQLVVPAPSPQPPVPAAQAAPASVPADAAASSTAPLAAGALLMLALLLTASSSASAASPLRLPTNYEPTPTPIVIDSPLFYGPVYESQRGQVLLPNSYYAPDANRWAGTPAATLAAGSQCDHCSRRSTTFNGYFVPQASGLAQASTCRLPDKGPVIFITYYWAPWCEACREGNDATLALRDAGWKVLAMNGDDETGYMWARADKVNFVPYWIVTVDGKETLRTTDYRTLYRHLGGLKSRQVSYEQQPVYQQPVYWYTSGNVGWWGRGPVRRWFAGGGFFRRMFRGRC